MAFPWLEIAQTGANLASQFIGNAANRRAQERADRYNRHAADVAFGREKELLQFQLDYNTPAAQMQRFKDAGLNPNLVYGQGSPGNMQSAPSVPVAAPSRAAQVSFPMLGTEFAQARLMASQADLLRTKKDESEVRQDLNRAQTSLVKANPYLSDGYVAALVGQMKASAEMKQQESRFKLQEVMGTMPDGTSVLQPQQNGMLIMEKQRDMLFRKYQLDVQKSANLDEDNKIKAEIIKSKEFQNDLQQIQVEWMKNADVTPQHIYQFIMMLLGSLIRR